MNIFKMFISLIYLTLILFCNRMYYIDIDSMLLILLPIYFAIKFFKYTVINSKVVYCYNY